MRIDAALHAALDAQIRDYRAAHNADPPSLSLTHDEIDQWRNQFDVVIPVGVLAYRGIPLIEAT